ncbi:MAG: prepilin-type N-terminal cleavage/methylation domain-containing protein [Pseudomonadota bacterium]
MRSTMQGFSMVELIVVMLLLAVLSSLAIPRLMSRNTMEERGAQSQLRGMLVHARQLAVAQQRDVCVLVNPNRVSAVYAPANGACNVAAPVAAPGGTGAYEVLPPNGVNFGGAGLVRFNARGQPTPDVNQTITVGSLALLVQRETGVAN